MALVVADVSISLDGYVSGPNDSRENPFGDGAGTLHDWFGDAATDEDRAILQQLMDRVGGGRHGSHLVREERRRRRLGERRPGWGDPVPGGGRTTRRPGPTPTCSPS